MNLHFRTRSAALYPGCTLVALFLSMSAAPLTGCLFSESKLSEQDTRRQKNTGEEGEMGRDMAVSEEDMPTLDMAACPSDACAPGDTRCDGEQLAECVVGTGGCGSWSARACDGETRCVADGETAACVEVLECPDDACVPGAPSCGQAGKSIVQCVVGSDGCPVEERTACGATEVCEGGSCVEAQTCTDACALGATKCAVGGKVSCVMDATNTCTVWSTPAPCVDSACELVQGHAECVVPSPACAVNGCTHEQAGLVSCVGESAPESYQICGLNAQLGCYAWSTQSCADVSVPGARKVGCSEEMDIVLCAPQAQLRVCQVVPCNNCNPGSSNARCM